MCDNSRVIRERLFWLALVSVSSVIVVGARPADQASFDALRLENEWNTAHLRGDFDALDRILASDIAIVVPGMRIMNKTDALGMVGRMTFDRYESLEIRVRPYSDTTIVTGRIRRSRRLGDSSATDDWQFTKVYMRRDGQWQVVSFHASNAAP